jgi:uncharacterized damage-inducible protein DinB
MTDPRHLLRFFEVHQWIFANHLKDVSDEEGLRPPPGGGNCLNWIVGHIVVSRNDVLALLGAPPFWSPAEAGPYLRGSSGTLTAGSPRTMAELQIALDGSYDAIRERMSGLSPEDLARSTEKGTVGGDLAFLQFHESYHAGQVGLTRRLLGKEGVIR